MENLWDYRDLDSEILADIEDLNEYSSPVRCWSATIDNVLTNWFEFYAGPEPDVESTNKIYVKIYSTDDIEVDTSGEPVDAVSEKLNYVPYFAAGN